MCRTVCVLVLFGFAAAALAEDAPTTAPAGRTPTNKWYYFTRCDQAHIVAHEPGALWFAADPNLDAQGLLWRYDLKTGRVQSLSVLDGVEAITGPDAPVPGKDLSAVQPLCFAGRVAIPGKGWVVVPRLARMGPLHAGVLRADGALVCQRNVSTARYSPPASQLLEYTDRWRYGSNVLGLSTLIPVEQGYISTNLMGFHETGSLYDRAGQQIRAGKDLRSDLPDRALWLGVQLHRVAGRTYVVVGGPDSWHGLQQVFEVTTGVFQSRAGGDIAGVDLAGKGFLTGRTVIRRDRRFKFRVQLPEGETADTPWIDDDSPSLCRDSNGHVWVDAFRWDGRRWELVVPLEHHVSTLEFPSDIDYRPRLSLAGDRWSASLLTKDTPEEMFAYDPARSVGWVHVLNQSSGFLNLQRVSEGRVAAMNTIKVYGNVPPDLLLDADGAWWWSGQERDGEASRRWKALGDEKAAPLFDVIRVNGKQRQAYVLNGVRGGCPVYLCQSRNGRIWAYCGEGWMRWSPSSDTFVPGEPYDEFSFVVGGEGFAMVVPSGPFGRGMWRDRSDGLRRRVGGKWIPVVDPLNRRPVRCVPGMCRGDRILVCGWVGYVFEYDTMRDRWALLCRGDSPAAFFDSLGRRVIVFRDRIWVYDGDPFDETAGANRDRLSPTFQALLARLDDDSYLVRDRASAELQTQVADYLPAIRLILQSKLYSAEVRSRLADAILQARLDRKSSSPVDLLSHMNPPLEPDAVPFPTDPIPGLDPETPVGDYHPGRAFERAVWQQMSRTATQPAKPKAEPTIQPAKPKGSGWIGR